MFGGCSPQRASQTAIEIFITLEVIAADSNDTIEKTTG
jgi:hypothetical protein